MTRIQLKGYDMGQNSVTCEMLEPKFPIVAIGASAGGVEALTAFFRRMATQPRAAFVVVTHLAAHRDSLLPDILGRCTAMPVIAADDGLAVEPGHVYVIAPNAILTVTNDHLAVIQRGDERNLIDLCLVSLANSAGKRAVAIILSGTGTDGAIGVKAVRAAGGFTLAQGTDGSAPSHHGMPDAAIATGFVDCVLPIQELADRVATHVDGFVTPNLEDGQQPQNGLEDAKQELFALLQSRVGHDFSGYKQSTFLRRVERRMQVHHVPDLASYLRLARMEPEEVDALFRDLLIGVTEFFRDIAAFDVIGEMVVPHLLAGRGMTDSIRVWVPGCATGEEAYSIAITLLERLERLDRAQTAPRLQIFATDVDERALAVARTGRYPVALLETMSPERLERFFVREDGNCIVAKELRDVCLFSCHSLIRDPPFSRIDLISCRNLLIYLDVDVQNQVIPLFHYALRPGGMLFLGASEHIGQHADLFAPLDKKHRIFSRRDRPSRLTLFSSFPRTAAARGAILDTGRGERDTPDTVRRCESLVLEKYAPAHVIVTRDWDVVHYSVRTGKYLEPPAGAPSNNLLDMARAALRLPLRSALYEAADTGRRTTRENVAVEVATGSQVVTLSVEPLQNGSHQQVWLIVFTDVGTVSDHDGAEGAADLPSPGKDDVLQLENELRQTREQLQSIVEEYQASVEEMKSSNEEILSVNEELQSSNEELETSKEELQSLNEELHTVNAELAHKVDELDRSNSDLKNLFDSTQIATIFLDEQLVIRSFTPAVQQIFKLIPSDCGRPLSDIVSHLAYDDLASDVAAVVSSMESLEKTLVSRDGRTYYLMRIFPYRTTDGATDGAIVTFLDVPQLQLMVSELNHRVKNILAVVMSMASQMVRRYGSMEAFADAFLGRITGLAKTHEILSRNGWSSVSLGDLIGWELAAFVADAGRASHDGPALQLRPRAVTTLGIIIHELATNAMKYGALSQPEGHLDVNWRLEDRDGRSNLILRWRERGGPPVVAPTHKGFGTEMIERSVAFEFAGTATLDYDTDGLVATLVIPADEVVAMEVVHES